MSAIIITLLIGLISLVSLLIYHKFIKNKNPEAYIKFNFVDFRTNNFYDTFSLYSDKKAIFKNRKIKGKSLFINVFGFRKREILNSKLILFNSIKNSKQNLEKTFRIKIYKKSTNVINIKINNEKNFYNDAEIIFYTSDKRLIKLSECLELNDFNINRRKRLLMYNYDEKDIKKIINDNIKDKILRKKAIYQIKHNKNKLLLINFYINSKNSNILIFIEEEKPLIIPTKEEKQFFYDFYFEINNNIFGTYENLEKICEKYKNCLVKRQIIFGEKIMNLEDEKNRNIYFSFINQGINCLFENNIISKNDKKDYYFILGYILFYAYLYEKGAYKLFLNNFNDNIYSALKENYSYADLMKIGISFTIFWTNKLKLLSIEFNNKYNKDTPFKKGFEFFKSIINDLNENSDLTFIYLQINSGSGLNLINNEQCYKMSMISVEDIKSHIIENIPKYFYIFYLKKNIYVSTDVITKVMSFNTKLLFEYTNDKSVENNIMNVTLAMLHESGYSKFHKNVEVGGECASKYCINKSFELVNLDDCNGGESGKFVDYFLYNSCDNAAHIIFSSKRTNELMNKNLFTDSLDELHNVAGKIIENNKNINIQREHINTEVNNPTNLSSGFEMDEEDIERFKSLRAIGADVYY